MRRKVSVSVSVSDSFLRYLVVHVEHVDGPEYQGSLESEKRVELAYSELQTPSPVDGSARGIIVTLNIGQRGMSLGTIRARDLAILGFETPSHHESSLRVALVEPEPELGLAERALSERYFGTGA